jgi:hypothetical protein
MTVFCNVRLHWNSDLKTSVQITKPKPLSITNISHSTPKIFCLKVQTLTYNNIFGTSGDQKSNDVPIIAVKRYVHAFFWPASLGRS